MPNPYAVRTVVAATGERMPLLVDSGTGVPLFDATVYAATEIRARNRASNTIERHLRSILIFQLFVDSRGIDLPERMRDGRVLDVAEIDELTRICRLPLDQYVERINTERAQRKPSRVASLEGVRLMQNGKLPALVDADTASTRLRAIRDYVDWLIERKLLREPKTSSVYKGLYDTQRRIHSAMTARAPAHRDMSTVNQREGLPPEVKDRLLTVISPLSPENPWKSDFARCRNELAIRLLYHLGVRRGELLGIKLTDLNLKEHWVAIHRRADDPDDPRPNQPRTKTLARMIGLTPKLCALLQQYILNARRAFPAARKHDYLFVADRTGEPMALATLNKVFVVLRAKVPRLPNDISPHVMRHCFNDNFAETCERKGVPMEVQVKTLMDIMGWANESSAAAYRRRWTRNKAKEVLLDMQMNLTVDVPSLGDEKANVDE